MTTTITINSLQRYNFEEEYSKYPNPFDFVLSPQITSNWTFERIPFSRTALNRGQSDGFKIRALRVMIPKSIVPTHQPMFFLEIRSAGNPTNIDKSIGPTVKNVNNIGMPGVTGCVNAGLGNYSNTWPLYPSSAYSTHWIYESCAFVSTNTDWKGLQLTVKLRDQFGYVLTPPNFPADGITGFTGNICNFKMTPVRKCCDPCKKRGVSDCCHIAMGVSGCPAQILPSPEFGPLFQNDNQLIIILNAEYVQPTGGLSYCDMMEPRLKVNIPVVPDELPVDELPIQPTKLKMIKVKKSKGY